MIPFLSALLVLLQALFALILNHEGPGDGAAKRQAVIDDMEKALAEAPLPMVGIALKLVPKSIQDWAIGLMVDSLVAAANKAGFFEHGASSSAAPSHAG